MHGLGREGKFQPARCDRAHDLQVDPLAHFHVFLPFKIRGEPRELNVERPGAVVRETNHDPLGMDTGIVAQQRAEIAGHGLDLFGRCGVGQAECLFDAALRPAGMVRDGLRGHQLVGNDDQVPRLGSHPGRAQADVLDLAFAGADLHDIAHLEWLVHHHHERAEHVGNRVLRREGERQTADAQPGEKRLDRHPLALRNHQHAEDHRKDEERLLDQRHEGRDRHLPRVRKFPRVIEGGAAGADHRAEHHGEHGDLGAALHPALHFRRERQHGQRSEDSHDHN